MAQLVNAPVIYVLGVLRIPQMSDPERFAKGLHSELRKAYPHFEPFDVPQVQVQVGESGLEISHQEVKLWQLASADRKWALIVNAGLIGLHTVGYVGHEDFFRRFGECVNAAVGLEDVGVELVEGIALRYVDLIVPGNDSRLGDYLVDGVLPSDIKGVTGLRVQSGVHSVSYATEVGNLRMQVLRQPPTVLPPELNTPITARNGWGSKRPEDDFAVMDVDHGVNFDVATPVAEVNVVDHLHTLRKPIRGIFHAVATPHAMKEWKGEE